jgi:FlaA1/EpsC-like NDP-sugar epimerase
VPDSDIEISLTGLRPGEKLYEELSHKGENLQSTDHQKIMRFVTKPLPLSFVRTAIEEFVRCINVAEPGQVKAMLKALIPEYQPFNVPDEKIIAGPRPRTASLPVAVRESRVRERSVGVR